MLYYELFHIDAYEITYKRREQSSLPCPTSTPKVVQKYNTSQNFFSKIFQNLETRCVCGELDPFQPTTPPIFWKLGILPLININNKKQ